MYEKLSERSDGAYSPDLGLALINGLSHYKVLDEKIDDMAEIVRLHYNLQELCDPASATEVFPFFPLIKYSQ
jgi:hypothetical protein